MIIMAPGEAGYPVRGSCNFQQRAGNPVSFVDPLGFVV
jgi:hypothetical protein